MEGFSRTHAGFLYLMFVPSWTPVYFRTDKQSAVIIQASTKRPYIEISETGRLVLETIRIEISENGERLSRYSFIAISKSGKLVLV